MWKKALFMDLVRNVEKDDTFCMSLHRNKPLSNDLQTGVFWMDFWKSIRRYVDICWTHFYHSFKPISAKSDMFSQQVWCPTSARSCIKYRCLQMPAARTIPLQTDQKCSARAANRFQGGGTCFNVSWFWMYMNVYVLLRLCYYII